MSDFNAQLKKKKFTFFATGHKMSLRIEKMLDYVYVSLLTDNI